MGPQASHVLNTLFNSLDNEEDVLDTCAGRSWTLYFFFFWREHSQYYVVIHVDQSTQLESWAQF